MNNIHSRRILATMRYPVSHVLRRHSTMTLLLYRINSSTFFLTHVSMCFSELISIQTPKRPYTRTWVSYDGGFANSRKAKKVDENDICLSDGLQYYVKNAPYEAWAKVGGKERAVRMVHSKICPSLTTLAERNSARMR